MTRLDEIDFYFWAYKNAKSLFLYYHYKAKFDELMAEYDAIEAGHVKNIQKYHKIDAGRTNATPDILRHGQKRSRTRRSTNRKTKEG